MAPLQGAFDGPTSLGVSFIKGEFLALTLKGARLASRLSSTRDYVAAFSALDG